MREQVEASGASVEEAIERALAELGAAEDEAEIEIVSEGPGTCVVRARLRSEREPAIEHDEPDDDLLNDQADAAEDFLNGLLDILQLEGEAAAEIEGSSIVVDMEGPNMGLLIGRHGATLEALQDLTRAVVLRSTENLPSLTLDIEGYRARQRAAIERRVRGIAAKVRKTGEHVALEPMTAYERKIVHTALAAFPEVATASEGEDPDRHIVIKPA